MRYIKRYLIALMLATTLFIYAHKPSDHEIVSESTTETQSEITQKYPSEDKPLQAPSPPIIVEGKAKVDAKPTEKEEPKALPYELTFYTAKCKGCSGITASGYDVRSTVYYKGMRVLSADRSIPLYTIMRVKLADGTVFDGIVLDRGGAIKGARLDVLVATYDEAYRLGRKQVTVTILQNGKGR